MRELDRNPSESSLPERCAIVGAGRLGHALATALTEAGIEVEGPLGRGARPTAPVVLLTVPDAEIRTRRPKPFPSMRSWSATAAAQRPSTSLGDHEGFSLHPLMTVPEGGRANFEGAGCAVAGSTPRAVAVARALATALKMRPVEVADRDRAAYHAAASIAANFLVTLEGQAERLAATAGVPREHLVPLARAALENWAANGAEHALTGPVARKDEATIARQRAAIQERAPDLLDSFDALVAASRVLLAAA